MTDPSVDDCLDLVLARIRKTAAPATLPSVLEGKLRGGLRPDFVDALKTPGSWGLYGSIVLRMAGFVGRLARVFDERTGHTGTLSEGHVLLAFALVKPLCELVEGTPLRAQEPGSEEGRYCQRFDTSAIDDELNGLLARLR